MSARRTRWQRLGQVLVGLTAGVICLVMWGGSASAVEAPPAPTPPPPSLASSLDGLLGQTTATLDELLDPLGVGLAPVVDPLTDQVVVPTVGTVETTLAGVTQPLAPVPPAPTLPTLPELPVLPSLPDPGAVVGEPSAPATVVGALGALDGVGAADTTLGATGGSTISERLGSSSPAGASPRHELIESASVEGGSSSGPAFPTPAPLVEAALGTLAPTGAAASSGLVLLAVLVGLAAVAASPLSRRLALAGPLSPRAPAYAIATPPG